MFPLSVYKKYLDSLYKKLSDYKNIADVLSSKDNWTIRNNVAHLIDSASNNHQRFVRLQLNEKVTLPGYEAESWCSASGIKDMPYVDLVELWKLYNVYLLEIISNIKDESLNHVWINEADGKSYTLDFLVKDYFDHMKLHEKMIDDIAYSIVGEK